MPNRDATHDIPVDESNGVRPGTWVHEDGIEQKLGPVFNCLTGSRAFSQYGLRVAMFPKTRVVASREGPRDLYSIVAIFDTDRDFQKFRQDAAAVAGFPYGRDSNWHSNRRNEARETNIASLAEAYTVLGDDGQDLWQLPVAVDLSDSVLIRVFGKDSEFAIPWRDSDGIDYELSWCESPRALVAVPLNTHAPPLVLSRALTGEVLEKYFVQVVGGENHTRKGRSSFVHSGRLETELMPIIRVATAIEYRDDSSELRAAFSTQNLRISERTRRAVTAIRKDSSLIEVRLSFRERLNLETWGVLTLGQITESRLRLATGYDKPRIKEILQFMTANGITPADQQIGPIDLDSSLERLGLTFRAMRPWLTNGVLTIGDALTHRGYVPGVAQRGYRDVANAITDQLANSINFNEVPPWFWYGDHPVLRAAADTAAAEARRAAAAKAWADVTAQHLDELRERFAPTDLIAIAELEDRTGVLSTISAVADGPGQIGSTGQLL